jgi:quercetin dioxygenase-like cupin family protein
MKSLVNNFKVLSSVTLLVFTSSLPAQTLPLSDEAITLDAYPVEYNKEEGTSIARLGVGQLQQVDATLIEIPPGGNLPPHRHMAEEILYIISGEGYTLMWPRDGEKKVRYDWVAGDLLSPSLNAWHQHINSSANTPVRYVSITTTPVSKNLFPHPDFLSSSDLEFKDRWQQGITQQPEYIPEGGFENSLVVRMRVGHKLPNINGRELRQRRKGAWGITITPDGDLAGNHVLEMEVREKDGEEFTDEEAHMHRHPWEVVYVVLDGAGYSIMRKKGEPVRRVNWQKGDLLIIEANEYHDNRAQENTRTRYLQVKASGYFHGVGDVGGIVLEEDEIVRE